MTFGTRRVYPSFWRRSRLLHVQPINVAASSKHREVPTVLLFHCLLLSQVEGMELRTFLEIRPCVLSRYSAILSTLASSVLSAPYIFCGFHLRYQGLSHRRTPTLDVSIYRSKPRYLSFAAKLRRSVPCR
jgi:hypothetical protein